MNDELLEKVVNQILADVVDEDYTAIEELLNNISETKLRGFLKEGIYDNN